MLQMFIHNMLIDYIEVDFSFCDTVKKREERVKELAFYLSKEHFEHAFMAHVNPVFYLIASSKANDIIMEDFDNKLVPELGKLEEQNYIFNQQIINSLRIQEWDFDNYPNPEIVLITKL